MGYIKELNIKEEYINYFNIVSTSIDKIYMDISNLIEDDLRFDLTNIKDKYELILKGINELREDNDKNLLTLENIEKEISYDRNKYEIENIEYDYDLSL